MDTSAQDESGVNSKRCITRCVSPGVLARIPSRERGGAWQGLVGHTETCSVLAPGGLAGHTEGCYIYIDDRPISPLCLCISLFYLSSCKDGPGMAPTVTGGRPAGPSEVTSGQQVMTWAPIISHLHVCLYQTQLGPLYRCPASKFMQF
jgi:hypothetical protein